MSSEPKLKKLEHWFKAFIFGVFKLFLKKGQKDFVPLVGSKIEKVLFLRPEKIGDMVISFPVFDGLKKHFPHIQISILGSPRNLPIIKNDPRFDKIYLYTKKPWLDFKTLLAMRRGKYDCVVDMIGDDSVTALFLTQLSAPGKPRIGISKVKYREYYDFNYSYRLGNTGHIVDNTLKLLEAFQINSDQVSGYAAPYICEADNEKAGAFFNKMTGDKNNLMKFGYNLSAGAPTRIWAEEKSIDLLRRITETYKNCKIILFTVPSERNRADGILKKLNGRVELLPDKLNLIEVSAMIARLDIMISPDTSLVHIARALKVPVVGLYSRYMKNFLLWRPYGQEHGAVVSGNDDNIFDITVDQVFDTFNEVVHEKLERV